jgi:[ribosomal protein S5]-alanine N-acetyltransferase
VDVPPIRSSRLELVSLGPDVLAALVEGRRTDVEAALDASIPDDWPDEHDARFLRLRLEQMRDDPGSRPWLVRGLVLDETAHLVGHAGFHGPPGTNGPGVPDAVEIGYTIFDRFRRSGYATEAVRALTAWAREQGVTTIVASIAPDNEPSLTIVRHLGFVPVGEQWDEEDGRELVFRLDSTASSTS